MGEKMKSGFVGIAGMFLFVFFALSLNAFAHGGDANAMSDAIDNIVLLVHVIAAVFMAWPLYALITVNERPKINAPLGDKIDDFIESIIKKNSKKCFVFQLTALLTGIYLAWSHEELGFESLLSNWPLIGKLLGLIVLMTLLSYVVFRLQPEIDRLFEVLKKGKEKEKIAGRVNGLRLKRKKIASICLFTVLIIILLALQIREPFSMTLNAALVVLIALFSYRAFKAGVPYGWG